MKLVYLGLLLIFTFIIIYEVINYKEGFDGNFEAKKEEHKKWTKNQHNFWKSENSPGISKSGDEHSFLKFNKDKTNLVETNPVYKNEKSDLALEIERCETINSTGNCEELEGTQCGYCWDTDMITYGDDKGPFAHVCSENGWVPPGPRAGINCQKKKEQQLCSTMVDCGDSTGEKVICGWCPATGKGVPKKEGLDGGWVPKYDDDKCVWNTTDTFKGSLIETNRCEEFGQMFPCVGPNMETGPHNDACIQSQWVKGGCTGKVIERVKDPEKYTLWNKNAYSYIGDNVKYSVKGVADTGDNYTEAKKSYKQCYGTDIDSCENRFKPRPLDCLNKIYNESGCTNQGKLNPKNTPEWPNTYVDNNWMRNQNRVWSRNEYKSELSKIKTDANKGQRQAEGKIISPMNFDKAIDDNMKCYGIKPTIPWDKPCWEDFTSIMTSHPNININSETVNLSFEKAPSFKSLLVVSDTPNNENTWVNKYELNKTTYKNAYFPFWNFIKKNKDYWNANWSKFKEELLRVYHVRQHNSNLKFLNNSPFNILLETSNNSDEANRKGHFLTYGNEKILTVQAYKHENFPYWLFLQTAKNN